MFCSLKYFLISKSIDYIFCLFFVDRTEVCGMFERVHAINDPFTIKEKHQAGISADLLTRLKRYLILRI
jgi:hypothetical protein